MDYNNLLKNKTALVTAGANGIGYAIAKKFEEVGSTSTKSLTKKDY